MSSSELIYFNFISRSISIYGGLSLFILGIFGNFINIILFIFDHHFNKLTISIFLVFSFFGSQLNLITASLPQLIFQLTGHDPLIKYEIFCKLRWFFGPITGTIALDGICLAVINQYLLTLRNIRYHQWITQQRSYFICLFVLFNLILLLSPNLIYFTHWINLSNKTTCDIINPIAANYNVYIGLVIYSLIPIFVLLIFSFLTWLNVRRILIRRQNIEHTMIRLLIGQILLVLFTTIAFVISRIYSLYTKYFSKNSLQLTQENVALSVTTLFSMSTHCLSFYVYLFTSKTFRKNIRDIFVKRQNRIQPMIPLQNIVRHL